MELMLLRFICSAAWTVLAAGMLFQLGIRDRWDAFAVVFYLLPLPVLAGIAAVLAVIHQGRRIAAGAVFAALLAWWAGQSWSWHAPIQGDGRSDGEFRCLYWNLCRPGQPSEAMIEMVREFQPDVAGFGEPGPNFMEHEEAYEKALPGYECHLMPRGLILLSKWPARMIERAKLDRMGAYGIYEVSAPHRTVRIVIVDVHSDPFRPRRNPLMESLAHAADAPRGIIMGDFNTPAESVHFRAYHEQGWQSALDAAGRGFRETWFWRLPVLSLDQVWAGKGWQLLEARKISRWSSDHAAVFVRMR